MNIGDRVTADVPMGSEGQTRPFPGVVDKMLDTDGKQGYRVQFDDPLIYGGAGSAWFMEDDLHAVSG